MTCCYQYNEETDWYSGAIRPGFSALEVVFVQTGHDHCVITLIAHHTDHNLYCCSWTFLDMFPGPTLTIINLLMTPCGGLAARNTEDTWWHWWHVWQWDKYSALLPVTSGDWLPLPQTGEQTPQRITYGILNLPTYKKYQQNVDKKYRI